MKTKRTAGAVEKATINDVKAIQKLINRYAQKNQMLPRSLHSLYENIRSFYVCRNDKGRVIGCCALEIVWADMAEIRSLVVDSRYRRRGLGRLLIEQALAESEELMVTKTFTLTYIPSFFKQFGFKEVDKKELPHKIWTDCIHCAHFPDCNETAMIRINKI